MEAQFSEEMEGVMLAGGEPQDPLFTEDERRILEVYDRLEELQLEIALLKAQGLFSQPITAEVSETDIIAAQDELLKAKAVYQVKSNVIENILIASPIIKAVHAGQNALAIEQDLLPMLQKRDELSISLTKLSTKVLEVKSELSHVQGENIIMTRNNEGLAKTMLALAEEAKNQRKEDIDDPKARQQFDDLEIAMKTSRQRWRIMKGTASATIAGSGVDWARDPTLLQIVLDEE